ncbi:2248_t:CDS:2 [Paraglomus occultum]|uniref:2248_t:CDS:1 n=1 Tax=Paraglomus occultum TaxID=144539 RepID=A0A9N8WLR0_9GLOM|nr:2248_t:CDS:2 [Paraglomus occultum]
MPYSTTSLCKKPVNSHTTTSTIVVSLTRTNTFTPIDSTTLSTKKPMHSHTTASTIVASTNVPSSDVDKTNKILVIQIIGGLGGLSGLLFYLIKWTAFVDGIA